MLVFIDESYSPLREDGVPYALAGFGVSEFNYRKLMAAIFQIKESYFEPAQGLSSEERKLLRASRIASKSHPHEQELKATKLLTRKAAEYHQQTGQAASILLVEELLAEAERLDCRVFGTLSHLQHMHEVLRPDGKLPDQLIRLIERVQCWMAEDHPDESAILVFDAIDSETSRTLNQSISDFLFRSRAGKEMTQIVPSPFWVASDATPGSQVADIIAHILMNSMLPKAERKQLDHLWSAVARMEFRSKNGSMRGIRSIRRKTTDGSDAH